MEPLEQRQRVGATALALQLGELRAQLLGERPAHERDRLGQARSVVVAPGAKGRRLLADQEALVTDVAGDAEEERQGEREGAGEAHGRKSLVLGPWSFVGDRTFSIAKKKFRISDTPHGVPDPEPTKDE
ncbi:hypothetical protein D3C72_1107370 [compost metagenome]